MFDLRLHIQIQIVFFKVLASSFLSFGKTVQWSRFKLFHGHTFRVTGANAEGDYLAALRYAKRSLALIWMQREKGLRLDSVTFYCHKEKQKHDLKPYLSFVLKDNVSDGLYRDTMQVGLSFVWKVLMSLQLAVMTPFFAIGSCLSAKKSTVSLVLLQWVENNIMAQCFKGNGVERVYLFGGYENDQGLTGLICEKMGVQLVLVPSSNPIKNFYRQVVAHGFAFTSPFQRKEYEDLQSEWNVVEIMNWPLPVVKKLLPFVKTKSAGSNKIAFMTRGVWLRKLRGVHAQNNNKDFEYEEGCMKVLRDFLLQHPQYDLLILPHPMERTSDEFWQRTQSYYKEYFSGIAVSFPSDPSVKSYELFDQAPLALASISSVNIERLFCGYKTLYAPIGAEHAFFSGSSLDNVVARTPERLMQLLKQGMEMSEDEFFSTFDLENYRHLGD
jgi:hypothetical protein